MEEEAVRLFIVSGICKEGVGVFGEGIGCLGRKALAEQTWSSFKADKEAFEEEWDGGPGRVLLRKIENVGLYKYK